jgi:hypothetical protein
MATKRKRATKTSRKGAQVLVRVTAEEKEAWTRAAERDDRGGLSGWLRHLANQAAGLLR